MRPAMSEREIGRFMFRQALFERRGLASDKAEQWADRLLDRDRDGDDRRLCLECRHLQTDGGCALHREGRLLGVVAKFYMPVRDVLMRCPGFDWSKPA